MFKRLGFRNELMENVHHESMPVYFLRQRVVA